MDWIFGLLLVAIVISGLPKFWAYMHRTGAGGGGFVAGLGLILMSVLDLPAKDAMEEIDKRKEHGEKRQGEAGDSPD